MNNIIKINNITRPKSAKANREDVHYFAKQLAKTTTDEERLALIDKIYTHGFEDGYTDGRKNGKVTKLVMLKE